MATLPSRREVFLLIGRCAGGLGELFQCIHLSSADGRTFCWRGCGYKCDFVGVETDESNVTSIAALSSTILDSPYRPSKSRILSTGSGGRWSDGGMADMLETGDVRTVVGEADAGVTGDVQCITLVGEDGGEAFIRVASLSQ